MNLRELHAAIERAVFAAGYGLDDLDPRIGNHRTKICCWMVSRHARVEIIDRLLEEHHCRAGHS